MTIDNIYKRLATHTDRVYSSMWKNLNLMPDMCTDAAWNRLYGKKYIQELNIDLNTIAHAIGFIVYTDYAPDSNYSLEELFEYSDIDFEAAKMLAEKIREVLRLIRLNGEVN